MHMQPLILSLSSLLILNIKPKIYIFFPLFFSQINVLQAKKKFEILDAVSDVAPPISSHEHLNTVSVF